MGANFIIKTNIGRVYVVTFCFGLVTKAKVLQKIGLRAKLRCKVMETSSHKK
jgi:hypothetical protein